MDRVWSAFSCSLSRNRSSSAALEISLFESMVCCRVYSNGRPFLNACAKQSGTLCCDARAGFCTSKAMAIRVLVTRICWPRTAFTFFCGGKFLLVLADIFASRCCWLRPTSEESSSISRSLNRLLCIFSMSLLALLASCAWPSLLLRSDSAFRCSNKNADNVVAFLMRCSKASLPSLRTMVSGSSFSGRNRNFAIMPSRITVKVFSSARHAAFLPALSPS